LLEAMAAAVPVEATAVGGVPAVLDDAGGLLVPPDDPAALARAIERVRSDPTGAAARARTARARLHDRYSIEAWCASYTRVYRSALSPGPQPMLSDGSLMRGG
jgi:glycosyltransferase involved in cell wall biosynthesis